LKSLSRIKHDEQGREVKQDGKVKVEVLVYRYLDKKSTLTLPVNFAVTNNAPLPEALTDEINEAISKEAAWVGLVTAILLLFIYCQQVATVNYVNY
jgi:hypothetical protein